MSVNLYNAERYLDPTAYEALMNIEREAKRTAYKRWSLSAHPLPGISSAIPDGRGISAGLRCRRTVSPSRRTCCFLNSWRKATHSSAALASSSGWSCRASARRCGCSAAISQRAWRWRLKRPTSAACLSGTLPSDAWRCDGNEEALNIPLEEFLRPFFGPGERICLRIFDDRKHGTFKGAKLETTLSGLPGLIDTLKKHNEKNRGIYLW